MKKLLNEPGFHFVLLIIVITVAHGFRYIKNHSSPETDMANMNNAAENNKANFKIPQKQDELQTGLSNLPDQYNRQELLVREAVLLIPGYNIETKDRKYPQAADKNFNAFVYLRK